jgi:hypothetical protein
MFRLRRPARRRSEEFGTQHFGISEMSSTLDFSMRFPDPPMRTASEDRMKLSSPNMKPQFDNFLALTRTYRAEFLVAVMGSDAPESLQLAALAERRQRYEEGVAELRAKCGIDDVDGKRR